MKKIYVNESSISNIISGKLLPQFLFKLVKTHDTSLGDNDAFPTSYDYPFDYTVLKERYNEVCNTINELGLESLDEDYLVSELSSLVTRCKEIEKPIRDSLVKICENAINRLFAIPEETINFSFKLVDKIKFNQPIRMRPESNGEATYTFKDISDIDLSNKAIGKRRFINSLIQGASYIYSNIEDLYADDISKINDELLELYEKIKIINDYLLFIKKEKLSDDKPMQGSYVETYVGNVGEKSTIKAQGVIFPLLLHDAIRGLFEIFSVYGLPSDRKKAEYIVNKADFVLAEPWDLRLGVGLWNKIFGGIEDTNLIPYVFASFVKLPTDEFNLFAKEIFSNTEKGKALLNDLIAQAEHDNGYQQFTNRINARNVDKSIIQDSYFTGAETNGYELDSDSEDGDVIEEEGNEPNSEMKGILQNATIDNIDFIEGDANDYGEKVFLSVDGIEIPSELVNLDFRVVNKRFPNGKKQLLNIDINLDPSLRGMGLGTKIYAKAVYEFGAICSRFSTRHNDEGIRGIFKKLQSFNDIYVSEDVYDNIEGETINDYYAILKSQFGEYLPMQEGRYTKGDVQLLTENWAKDKRRIVSRTLNILKENLPWASSLDIKDIENKIVEDYFHGRKASNPKFRIYEPMIANILTREFGYPKNPTNKKEVRVLQKVLKYVWLLVKEGENVDILCKYNDSLGKMECDDFNSLMSKYYDKAKAYDEQMKDEANARLEQSPYSIHKVDSYEEANRDFSKWSYHGLPLCFTTGIAQWRNFTKDGENTAYVCLKDGWKDVPEEKGENFPYDDYGLSMIWVFVDGEGNLTNCCIRWNHNGEGKMSSFPYGGTGADDALTESSISNIVGVPFDSTFVPSVANGFTKEVEELVAKLAAGESGIDLFPNARKINDHLFIISINGKENFYDITTNEIVNPSMWFDNHVFFNYKGLLGSIIIDNKINFVNQFGEIVFANLWFDDTDAIYDHFLVITIGSKVNMIDVNSEKPNLLLPRWAMKISEYENYKTGEINYFILFDDGELYVTSNGNFENLHNVMDIFNGVVNNDKDSIDLYNALDGITHKSGIFTIGGGRYSNIVDLNNKSLKSPFFFNYIEKIDDYNCYECRYKKEGSQYGANILKEDGVFLLDLPFDSLPNEISVMDNKIFACYFKYQGRTRINFTREDGKLLLGGAISEWPIKFLRLDSGDGHIIYAISSDSDKWNLLNDDFQIAWKKPQNEWFDYVSTCGLEGYMEVTINEKENILNCETGELLINKEPQDWYYMVVPFKDKEGELIVKVAKDGMNNIVFGDGSMLFEEGDECKHIAEFNKDTLFIVKDNGGPCNLYDIPSRSYVVPEWFTEVGVYGDNVRFVLNGAEYYYDTLSKTLTNISENRRKKLEGLTPENINNESEISVLIPNKMWRIRVEHLDGGLRSNVIVNNNGHYEYLFDKWYIRIHKPIGNALCLLKSMRGKGDIYDISKNEFAFEDVKIINVDYDENLIFITMNNNDEMSLDMNYNVVTPQCELLFDEDICGISFDGPYLKLAKRIGITKKYELFDPYTKEYILGEYFDYIEYIRRGDIYVVGMNNPDDTFSYGGRHCSYNAIKNGELLFDQWYAVVTEYPTNSNYLGLINSIDYLKSELYIADIKTGKLISDAPIDFKGKNVAKIVKNGKVNFIDNNINPLLQQWADKASDFDSRGYITLTYGKENKLYRLIENQLVLVEQEGNVSIPSDFTWCNRNQIDLIDHILRYEVIGWREGRSEHTTTYRQKITVILKDGTNTAKSKIYTQRGDESCKWVMYEAYERLCSELGIKPAYME